MDYKKSDMGRAITIAIMLGNDEEGYEEMEGHSGHMGEHIKLAPAEQEYVESLHKIVDEYGKLANDDGNGIWVGYMSARENENAKIGVKCSNCAFYCSEMGNCHIVAQKIEPNGLCRLAAIGEGLVKGKRK